ncbi:hypothetical protein BH11PSE8_BH11PSE8_40240 [soil metagenome]
MFAFRVLLVAIVATVLVYTGIVIAAEGFGFMAVFFGDILAMKWPGQFNLDFSCLLLLSGLWVAWRHQFSLRGLGLGLAALLAGSPFLSVYLLVASLRAKGDMKVLLLGPARA